MQKSKHEPNQNLLSSPSASAAAKLSSASANKLTLTAVSSNRNKSPTTITPVSSSSSNNNPAAGQQIAFIQPSNPSATTVLPLETVLQRITEEQSNKTKKLLSDLSTKRRSRQRKIMVVNTGNPPRNMLPKLNLINGQQIIISSDLLSLNQNNNNNNSSANKAQSVTVLSPSITPNTSSNNLASMNSEPQQQQQQQNIVYSRPVAVARQIVNNLPTPNANSAGNYVVPTFVQETSVQASSSKTIIPSFHKAYSNLMPKLLNTQADNQTLTFSNVNNDIQISNNENNNNMNAGSPQTLNDMSLLDLSMNTNDSLLFGSSANLNTIVNENANLISNVGAASDSSLVVNNNGHHMLPKTGQTDTIALDSNIKEASLDLNGVFSSVVANDSDTMPGFKLSSNDKVNEGFSQILNENSNSTLTSKFIFSCLVLLKLIFKVFNFGNIIFSKFYYFKFF